MDRKTVRTGRKASRQVFYEKGFHRPSFQALFQGVIRKGERYRRPFGSGFEFVLEPTAAGWEIAVLEPGREENLARLTPPLHFVPNPREIEGWHLAEAPPSCIRPYGARSGPGNTREFIFSPEVGRTIQGAEASKSVTPEDIDAVRRFGRGEFHIEKFTTGRDSRGCPLIETLEFKVTLEGGYGP